MIGRLLGTKQEPMRPHEGPVLPDEPKKRGAGGRSIQAIVPARIRAVKLRACSVRGSVTSSASTILGDDERTVP